MTDKIMECITNPVKCRLLLEILLCLLYEAVYQPQRSVGEFH